MDFREVFGSRKPVIGVVHLLPMPGSPGYRFNLDEVVKRAVGDAEAYYEAGFNGIIVENYGDIPYYPNRVGPETIASMTYIATRIRDRVDIPVGINVLRNDAISAIAIAHVVGGRFIRVNVLTEAYVTDQGIISGRAYEVLRYRSIIGAGDVMIFADVHVKHAYPLLHRSIEDSALDMVHRGLADALIVTGRRTGMPPDVSTVASVKKAVGDVPVIVGSGITEDNVGGYVDYCDGFIVGTSVKRGRVTLNPVDRILARRLVKKLRDLLG